MRDERRKEVRSKQGQTNNKAKQHSTPKAVTFPKKNERPRVGLEPTTLYTLDRALCTRQVYMYIHLLLLYQGFIQRGEPWDIPPLKKFLYKS